MLEVKNILELVDDNGKSIINDPFLHFMVIEKAKKSCGPFTVVGN